METREVIGMAGKKKKVDSRDLSQSVGVCTENPLLGTSVYRSVRLRVHTDSAEKPEDGLK